MTGLVPCWCNASRNTKRIAHDATFSSRRLHRPRLGRCARPWSSHRRLCRRRRYTRLYEHGGGVRNSPVRCGTTRNVMNVGEALNPSPHLWIGSAISAIVFCLHGAAKRNTGEHNGGHTCSQTSNALVHVENLLLF